MASVTTFSLSASLETIFHELGLDAHRFGFPYLDSNQRLIGPTEEAQLIKWILS
jgi:hypothetical protein